MPKKKALKKNQSFVDANCKRKNKLWRILECDKKNI